MSTKRCGWFAGSFAVSSALVAGCYGGVDLEHDHKSSGRRDAVGPELDLAQQAMAETGALLEMNVRGANIRFIETSPGAVLVTSAVPRGNENPLANPSLARQDFLQIYKDLTDEQPPPVLEMAAEHRPAVEDFLAPEQDEDEAVGQKVQALDGAGFRSAYCGFNVVCATDQTERREWGPYRVTGAIGRLEVLEGQVLLQIRDRRVRDWSNYKHERFDKDTSVAWSYTPPREVVEFRVKVGVFEVGEVVVEGNILRDRYHFTLDHW